MSLKIKLVRDANVETDVQAKIQKVLDDNDIGVDKYKDLKIAESQYGTTVAIVWDDLV